MQDGHFLITWRALEVIARGKTSGIERPAIDLVGKKTDEAMSILARLVTREIRLKAGEQLKFSQQNLWEICYFFSVHAIPATIKSFSTFLEAEGIPLQAASS